MNSSDEMRKTMEQVISGQTQWAKVEDEPLTIDVLNRVYAKAEAIRDRSMTQLLIRCFPKQLERFRDGQFGRVHFSELVPEKAIFLIDSELGIAIWPFPTHNPNERWAVIAHPNFQEFLPDRFKIDLTKGDSDAQT